MVQTQVRQPSLLRIMQSDYLALLALLFPVVTWVVYIATARFGFFPGLGGHDPLTGADAPFWLYLALVATVVGLPLLVWRIRSLQALFRRGIEVRGRITGLYFRRDRGRVEYTYAYEGQTYTGGSAVQKTGRTEELTPGTEVALLVDPLKPGRALIRDLYL